MLAKMLSLLHDLRGWPLNREVKYVINDAKETIAEARKICGDTHRVERRSRPNTTALAVELLRIIGLVK